MMQDSAAFFWAFLRDPTGIGSVWPSSVYLARAMVHAAQLVPGQVVVELGAGTGPVTRLLAKRAPDHPIMALEPVPELAAKLRTLPGIAVRQAFAQEVPQLLAEWGHPVAHRVVSSLPFAGWSEPVQNQVLDAVCSVLANDGRLVTFTYVHSQVLPGAASFRRQLAQRFHTVERSPVVLRNLPPAFVWSCTEPISPTPTGVPPASQPAGYTQ